MPMWDVPSGDVRVPGLAVDAGVLEHNLRAMADSAARRGLSLRPHAKTHKCLEIARRQVELGAVGLSVATVAEAEVFAGGGIGDLFIAYPVWAGDERGGRLAELARRVRLTVGVDSPVGAERLAAALGRGTPVRVLVEVDCGLHRSGVRPAGAAAVAIAAARAGLTVAGVFTFPGHSYGPGAAPGAAKDEAAALTEAAGAFAAAGLGCEVRSGGSTPSAALAEGPVTELRPGVYVFNDTQQVTMGSCTLDDVALAAVANVVSVPAADRFVLDTGSKILGADRPPWTPGHALLPGFAGWRIDRLWEHHAVAAPDRDAGPDGVAAPPRVGDQVIVIPNHVCTVVNLADQLAVVRDGQVTGHWQVAARGRND